MSKHRKIAGVCGAIVLMSGNTFADGPIVINGIEFEEPPAAMSIETDGGWRFEAAFSGGEMVGMIAVYSGAGGTPQSIRTAWFEPAGDGEWAVWGWQSATLESAAAYLRWFYQDDAMFEHATELAEVDWEGVEPAGEPVPVRYGFDANSPFQPVLEVVEPSTAEVIVEIGGAGMPVLAPLAVPAAGATGGWTLACVLGELAGRFSEFAEVTDLIDDAGVQGSGGCGNQAGLFDWCWPRTDTYNMHRTCTTWSLYALGSFNGQAVCERTRHCTQHYAKVKVGWDCSTTTTYHTYPATLERDRIPALPGPSCP